MGGVTTNRLSREGALGSETACITRTVRPSLRICVPRLTLQELIAGTRARAAQARALTGLRQGQQGQGLQQQGDQGQGVAACSAPTPTHHPGCEPNGAAPEPPCSADEAQENQGTGDGSG